MNGGKTEISSANPTTALSPILAIVIFITQTG